MPEKERLNIQVEPGTIDRWSGQARAAGYTTLSEYVRHVLDGRVQVVVGGEVPDPPPAKRGKPRRDREPLQ